LIEANALPLSHTANCLLSPEAEVPKSLTQ